MAREKYITREVTFTEVIALYLNKQLLTNEEQKTILVGSFDNEVDLLKELNRVNKDDLLTPIHILEYKVSSKLYGLKENDFINLAVELNPETRRPY